MKPLGNYPALLIGAAAAAVLAGVQYLGGHDLIGSNVVDALGKALDPTGGWAIPIIVAFVTHLFVAPADKPGL